MKQRILDRAGPWVFLAFVLASAIPVAILMMPDTATPSQYDALTLLSKRDKRAAAAVREAMSDGTIMEDEYARIMRLHAPDVLAESNRMRNAGR